MGSRKNTRSKYVHRNDLLEQYLILLIRAKKLFENWVIYYQYRENALKRLNRNTILCTLQNSLKKSNCFETLYYKIRFGDGQTRRGDERNNFFFFIIILNNIHLPFIQLFINNKNVCPRIITDSMCWTTNNVRVWKNQPHHHYRDEKIVRPTLESFVTYKRIVARVSTVSVFYYEHLQVSSGTPDRVFMSYRNVLFLPAFRV